MSEQIIIIDNVSYQVIKGNIYYHYNHDRPLQPRQFLIKKPILPLLVYLKSGGVSIKDSFDWCNRAAEIGDLKALQWLRAGGAPWDKMVCAFAAHNGYLEVLKWLRANGAPWNELTCSYAASNCHLEILQWARSNGAPWDEMVCLFAFGNRHFKILKWAYANGCPCYDNHEKEVQKLLLKDKDINLSLQCKEKRSTNNQELSMSKKISNKVIDVILPNYIKKWVVGHRDPLRAMVDQVVNEYHKVTYDVLPACLSNLVINYL